MKIIAHIVNNRESLLYRKSDYTFKKLIKKQLKLYLLNTWTSHITQISYIVFFLNSNQLYCSKHINYDQNMEKYILI